MLLRGDEYRMHLCSFARIMSAAKFSSRPSATQKEITDLLIRATSHLLVKREWPLIIIHSFYSKNIMYYYFYVKHVREEE